MGLTSIPTRFYTPTFPDHVERVRNYYTVSFGVFQK